MSAIVTVAIKEFTDGVRNRWVVSITIIFAILALGLANFGAAASGQQGIVSLPSTIVSMASLAVFLIPLIALLLAYDAFVSEAEAGTLLLLLSYPISRLQLVLGKFLGQALLLALATILGFGCAAVLILLQSELDVGLVVESFTRFITSAILLGWVFIAFAYMISVSVSEKSKAAGLALVSWFVFVLLFDLAVLGLLVADTSWFDQQQLNLVLLANPTDIFRLINLIGLEQGDYQGVLSVVSGAQYSMMQLFSIMIAWIVVTLFITYQLFKRKKG